MRNPGPEELKRRLELLAPFFRDSGLRIHEMYAGAGVLTALPDPVFPVADARFRRTAGVLRYHPQGPIYFTLTRSAQLELGGPGAGIPLAEALIGYVQLARGRDLEDAGVGQGATEWYPPPRLVLDPDTSRLYIEDISRMHQTRSRQLFVPLEQYLQDRAQSFVEAFQAAL